ncbi:MAG: hypothetical protein AAB250_14205, partial [Bdellovibrionota bacterium]
AAGSIGSGSGNAGQVRFYDLGASGNNYVAFRAPDQITADLVFTMPGTLGAANSMLATDAAGSLTWITGGGTGDFLRNGSLSMTGQFLATGGTVGAPGISFGNDNDNGMYRIGANSLGFSSSGTLTMTVAPDGRVGIGTIDPQYGLDIQTPPGTGFGMRLKGGTWDDAVMTLETQTGSGRPGINFTQTGTLAMQIFVDNTSPWMYFNDGNNINSPSDNSMIFTEGGTLMLSVPYGQTHATGSKLDVRLGAISAGSQSSTLGGEVRFYETGNSGYNYVAMRAPANVTANTVWTLPANSGTANQVLTTSAANSLSWTTIAGGGDFMRNGTLSMTGQFLATVGSSLTPGVSFGGDNDTGMFQAGANTLAFSTAAQERMRIDSAGNVGIGTTAPISELNVYRASGSVGAT